MTNRGGAVVTSVLGLLAVLSPLAAGGCRYLEPAATDIVIVTLDTTRRDHLGCYGYERPVSPHIDEFAGGGDLYTRAYASSSWTVPTHASILTGLYPTDHGAQMNEVASPEAPRAALADDIVTLAEILSKRGYATGAFIGAPTLDRRFGLGQGFDVYDTEFPVEDEGRPADEVTRHALRWVSGEGTRPIFLLVNYFDPHKPYRPPDPCYTRFARGVERHRRNDWYAAPIPQQLRLYDAEICFMDAQFGELMRGLRERGRFRDAVIAVTADHGEAFGEHGEVGHARSLFEPLIHVPLLVKRRRQTAGREIDAPVETRELFYMLLKEAGVSTAGARSERRSGRTWVVSELMRGVAPSRRAPYRAVIQWPWKLVQPSTGEAALYDLSRDPGEDVNAWSTNAEKREHLETILGRWLADRSPRHTVPAVETDRRLEERLRALGYGS